MTYEKAKETKDFLTKINDEHSQALRKFLELGEDEVLKGLPKKEIRESKEYQECVAKFNSSFKQLKEYNKWFLKNFKKEYLKDRSKKRLTKQNSK